VGPRVTIGRMCTTPPSFTTRAMSVAKWIGAPSRRPPARPTVPALSRSLICLSARLTDGGCESFCVRRDCAILDPQRAGQSKRSKGPQALLQMSLKYPFCSIHKVASTPAGDGSCACSKTSAGPFGISKRPRKRIAYLLCFSPSTRVSAFASDCNASTRSRAFSMPAAAAS
jgi:hypothetical protein